MVITTIIIMIKQITILIITILIITVRVNSKIIRTHKIMVEINVLLLKFSVVWTTISIAAH